MLGSELLPRLLSHGHEVYALVRKIPPFQHPHLHYLQGDIKKYQFGIGKFYGIVDTVIHLAAVTSLRSKEVETTNLPGVKNVVSFCLENKISKLYYASTLYVAGRHQGIFSEDNFDVGQTFKNPYEESKYQAELFLRSNPLLNITIFRPGILIGRYEDGKSSTFQGFYRPLRAIYATHAFAERSLGFPKREILESRIGLPPLTLPVRIYGEEDSTLALTPVDWAADTMLELIEDSNPLKQCYHLCPSVLPTNRQISSSVCEALHIQGLHTGPGPTRNPLDLFYNRLIKDFSEYLHSQPVFETSVGQTCPPVNTSYLTRVITYWRDNDDRREQEALLSGSRITE